MPFRAPLSTAMIAAMSIAAGASENDL